MHKHILYFVNMFIMHICRNLNRFEAVRAKQVRVARACTRTGSSPRKEDHAWVFFSSSAFPYPSSVSLHLSPCVFYLPSSTCLCECAGRGGWKRHYTAVVMSSVTWCVHCRSEALPRYTISHVSAAVFLGVADQHVAVVIKFIVPCTHSGRVNCIIRLSLSHTHILSLTHTCIQMHTPAEAHP